VTDSSVRYGLDDSSALGVPEARAMRPLAGLPAGALAGRRVLVYRAAPSAMTNGISGAPRAWALRAAPRDKWASPLMGWGAGDDTLAPAAAGARFETVEAAVAFAERAGWAWEVADAPPAPAPAPIARDAASPGNQYANNFLSLEVQAALKRAGPRRGRAVFAHPEAPTKTSVSTWVNARKTDFGPDAWRPRGDTKQGPSAWTGPAWPPARPTSA